MENDRKPYETRTISIRMPVDIYTILANTARQEERSVTQQVLFIIRAAYGGKIGSGESQ